MKLCLVVLGLFASVLTAPFYGERKEPYELNILSEYEDPIDEITIPETSNDEKEFLVDRSVPDETDSYNEQFDLPEDDEFVEDDDMEVGLDDESRSASPELFEDDDMELHLDDESMNDATTEDNVLDSFEAEDESQFEDEEDNFTDEVDSADETAEAEAEKSGEDEAKDAPVSSDKTKESAESAAVDTFNEAKDAPVPADTPKETDTPASANTPKDPYLDQADFVDDETNKALIEDKTKDTSEDVSIESNDSSAAEDSPKESESAPTTEYYSGLAYEDEEEEDLDAVMIEPDEDDEDEQDKLEESYDDLLDEEDDESNDSFAPIETAQNIGDQSTSDKEEADPVIEADSSNIGDPVNDFIEDAMQFGEFDK